MDMPVNVPFLLPFTDWVNLSDELTQIITDASENDTQVRFVWPTIRHQSDVLALFITSYELQLRPVIFPTQTNRLGGCR